MERAAPASGLPCGHALMASCPPSALPDPSVPWTPVASMTGNATHNQVFKIEDVDDDDDALLDGTVDYVGKDGSLDLVGNVITQKTWDIPSNDLAGLMNLSNRLNLAGEGEITPVHAWGMVRTHERFMDLGKEEIKELALELVTKVRCYGFGAVLEEFEVRDALDNIFFRKPDITMLMN